jgi:hypothetical protein
MARLVPRFARPGQPGRTGFGIASSVLARMAAPLLLVLLSSGCASGPAPAGTTPAASPAHPRFRVALDAAGDYRDFSRMELLAPELRGIFNRDRDVYVFDGSMNPFNVEFTSGSAFRWDRSVGEMVQDAVSAELGRSDYVQWARPMPVSDPPDFVLHINVLELGYYRTDKAYFPQVSLEALVLDPVKQEVLAKAPARVTGEFSVPVGAGKQRLHTCLVEDWMEPDLREQMRRALEKTSERLVERLDEFLAKPRPAGPSAVGTGGGG